MNRKEFNPKLYFVTDRELSRDRSIEKVVVMAVKGGANVVQLREKDITTGEFVKIAKSLKNILAEFNVPLIINDRVDVALASDAEGVHIGQSDMNYSDARKIIGNAKIIGLSVENLEQAKEANNLDVDYIGLSPVFSTPTKTDINTQLGLEGVKEISKISKHKLVAIGGINKSNAKDLLEAGAHSLAVVSAICSQDNPEAAAKELSDIINLYTK